MRGNTGETIDLSRHTVNLAAVRRTPGYAVGYVMGALVTLWWQYPRLVAGNAVLLLAVLLILLERVL